MQNLTNSATSQPEGSTCFRPIASGNNTQPARHEPAVEISGRLALQATTEILEELDIGVIVCAVDGDVVLANDAGRRELGRGRPLGLDAEGRVELLGDGGSSLLHWRSALRAAVQAGRRQLVPIQDAPHTLMASVIPLRAQEQTWALVLLGRRRSAPDLAMEMLASRCQLTCAELGVLSALVLGRRVGEVAQDRGVKISTLRAQVSAVRAKLGARRVEDLVRIASELPPMRSALRSPPLPDNAAARRRGAFRTPADCDV